MLFLKAYAFLSVKLTLASETANTAITIFYGFYFDK